MTSVFFFLVKGRGYLDKKTTDKLAFFFFCKEEVDFNTTAMRRNVARLDLCVSHKLELLERKN